jgi:hypothetical protein
MHATALLFPLVTALTGAAMNIYNELNLGQGCWITEFPKDCGHGSGKTGEVCRTDMLSWVFGGIPTIFSFVTIVLNNLIIFVFVRKYCKAPSARRKLVKRWNRFARNQSTSMTGTDTDLEPSISRLEEGIIEAAQNSVEAHEEDANTLVMNTQQHRLRLISSQALFYVGAALICSLWTGLLRILETHFGKTAADEDEMFPLLLLQAWFLPLQGFFNLFIWTRPKYQKFRRQCPDQSRLSCFRRALFGNCENAPSSLLMPKKGNRAVMEEQEVIAKDGTCSKLTGDIDSAPSVSNTNSNIGPGATSPTFRRLPPGHLSSITASHGDFGDEGDPNTRPTVFKKVTFKFPDERPNRRWSAGGGSSSMKASYPTRMDSLDDRASTENFPATASLVSSSLGDTRVFDRMAAVGDAAKRGSLDSPILIPRRRASPPPSGVEICDEEEESTEHKALA